MTFLEKFELLKKSIPIPSVIASSSVDCDYTDFVDRCKNCYYSFDAYYLENNIYTYYGAYNKMLLDCHGMGESEKCYESVDCTKCHSCTYLINCNGSSDCHFSAYLNSCSDCFGCVDLTHKKYCIFNRQYTKEEYFKKIEELKTENPKNLLEQMSDLERKLPHPATYQSNSENCPYGNNIYNSKNCFWSFNTYYFENSGYSYYVSYAKNCWDVSEFGGNPGVKTISERCYENLNTETCYDCAFLVSSKNCTNCHYSDQLINCSDCFGCVGLKSKKYCILNNQLTKEQYSQALKEIKKELGWKT